MWGLKYAVMTYSYKKFWLIIVKIQNDPLSRKDCTSYGVCDQIHDFSP